MASKKQHPIIPQLWVNKTEQIETEDLIASDSTNNTPITYICTEKSLVITKFRSTKTEWRKDNYNDR